MRMRVLAALLGVALLLGCGKKAAPQPQAAEAGPAAPAAATPEPLIQASLQDIDKKVQSQQYEAAVGSLVALNGMPKNDQQRNEYLKRLRDVNAALVERAAQGDQQAQQAQYMLGRMLKGR